MRQRGAVRFDDVLDGRNIETLRRLSGLSRHTLYRLRDGATSPQPATRKVIAAVLEVEPDEIVYPADIEETR